MGPAASGVIGAVMVLLPALSMAQIDLTPVARDQWSARHAAHLASRAGFGATPQEIEQLARMTPRAAVRRFVRARPDRSLPAFDHSGVFDEGLDPFPPSRPATTELARAQGHALGVAVKPAGNRPLQPVVNRFFYWLRASRLETDRVAYWWAQRMLKSSDPLREKLALFWHGHFATNEDKVRDYRKMLKQLALLQELGRGSFRELLVGVAKDPAMLTFLDAGVNTKDSPNENFAREIMELFTMGVGNYSESDVQEAARAFTGWNVRGLEFHIDDQHRDLGEKTFLGHRGPFDGVEVIDLILAQPVAAEFIATKIYAYFVNSEVPDADRAALGLALRDAEFDVAVYLERLFLSNDFYTPRNVGSRIKSPVELLIGTYRLLDLERVPGVPDFNTVSGALGQRLMHPPTVAGWSHGRSWITPSLLFERSNFALDVLFPDIGFVPPDRYPGLTAEIVHVQDRLRQGMSIAEATKPTGVAGGEDMMAASNLLADREEAFNTRLGSMRGWQMALERVKPLSRTTASVDLTKMITAAELETPLEVVEYFARRFMSVTLSAATLHELAAGFETELGTSSLTEAATYMEEPLRMLLHRMLSLPEYQLG